MGNFALKKTDDEVGVYEDIITREKSSVIKVNDINYEIIWDDIIVNEFCMTTPTLFHQPGSLPQIIFKISGMRESSAYRDATTFVEITVSSFVSKVSLWGRIVYNVGDFFSRWRKKTNLSPAGLIRGLSKIDQTLFTSCREK